MADKYFIHTYGCQMNVHESEKLAGILRQRGYTEGDEADADLILLNTCCIRETAETHVLGNLGAIKKLKEKKPDLIVAVCGCMTQKTGTAERLKKRCPFINLIFGTHNVHLLGEYLDRLKENKSVIEVWDSEDGVHEDVPVYRTSGVNAWVNIMYGCNNFCSYCIVPYVRGRERSRDKAQIVSDVKRLLGEGYSEITLLGQNVNSYGNDLADPSVNFASLLAELSDLGRKYRLRFMTSHPKDLSEDVVRVMAQSPVAARYVHLPVQAGSDRILSMMNRRYTSTDYLKKIDTIRKFMPHAGISSDVMVGFPTETEEDFEATLRLVRQVRFNNLYTFIYSRRSGTPADKMDGQVDIKVKKERIKRLIDEQFLIGDRLAAECIGRTYEAMGEKYENGRMYGKTETDLPISWDSGEDCTGKFVKAVAIDAVHNKLIGKKTGDE